MLNSQLKTPADRIGRKWLEAAWTRFLEDTGARAKGWPWRFFIAQWQQHHNAATLAPTARTPKVRMLGGFVAAADTNSDDDVTGDADGVGVVP